MVTWLAGSRVKPRSTVASVKHWLQRSATSSCRFKALESEAATIETHLSNIRSTHKRPAWGMLKDFNSEDYSEIYPQFNQTDAEGWTVAGNVSHLQSPDRARLAKFWVSEFQKNPSDDLNEAVKKRETLRQGLKGIYEEIYRELLATADVIGVATTGLAKNNKI
ncbi:NFX1-type zinc finger-containing protein [Marssonina coronariae]|uniref:NFX1-type zinc finger-containing protein n=1 Tax=Diplocarpon coronariae TaxID=2795749 RepID=A0A218YSG3_9HELO|nr:NFX1-type zinc finger-containing protein [Marssonina coronariae]